MIDEAYTHISGASFHSDLVAKDKDVVILRTFSKIYGMAGLRAGAAIARPDLLDELSKFSSTMMPITGMAAASASLEAKYVVPERRKLIGDVRDDVFSFMEKHNFSYVPSKSNCFMVDTKRNPRDVIDGMRKEKVIIGRVWPAWPSHVRISIGTQEEMNKFKAAWLKVMA
jgi:histidinol-phosphate/aromatic aminotransferase/cobyric acid decarboxylase-like protein